MKDLKTVSVQAEPEQTDRWSGEYYKKHSQKQFETGKAVVEAMDFKDGESVLDVGCGDGRLTAEIAKRVPKGKVLGIDVSASMIDEAKKTFGNIPNLSFACIDATKFTAEKKFDRAVSFDTFHWIPDPRTALKNIYAALKPGGKLYIKMLTGNPISRFIDAAQKDSEWSSKLKPSYFGGKTPETIRPLLAEVGFVEIDPVIKDSPYVFENPKEQREWMMGWVPYATGLTEEQARDFLDTWVLKGASGKIETKGRSLHVTAQKPMTVVAR